MTKQEIIEQFEKKTGARLPNRNVVPSWDVDRKTKNYYVKLSEYLFSQLIESQKRIEDAPELLLEVVAGDDDEWVLEEVGSQNPIYKFLSDDKRFVKAIPYKPMRFGLVELKKEEV